MEERVPGETAEERGPVIMQRLAGNHAALHPKQDPDENHPGETQEGPRLTLREEQAGFCQDRSCTDHIATLQIIIKQLLEWQSPPYSVFVDRQKAFDRLD